MNRYKIVQSGFITVVFIFSSIVSARMTAQPEITIPLKYETEAHPGTAGLKQYCPACLEQVKDAKRLRGEDLARLHFPLIFGGSKRGKGSRSVD